MPPHHTHTHKISLNELLTLMAVGALERVTRVPAASYRTAGLEELSRL